jgi:hypothetical protein
MWIFIFLSCLSHVFDSFDQLSPLLVIEYPSHSRKWGGRPIRFVRAVVQPRDNRGTTRASNNPHCRKLKKCQLLLRTSALELTFIDFERLSTFFSKAAFLLSRVMRDVPVSHTGLGGVLSNFEKRQGKRPLRTFSWFTLHCVAPQH